METKRKFNKEIFKEMILYISDRTADIPTFASTHLNKALHYSDFFSYATTGKSISNETYIRQKFGQIPKHLVQARKELIDTEKLEIVEQNYFGKNQKRLKVKNNHSFELLTIEQKKIIDLIIQQLAGFGASGVSEIAHQDLAWQYLENGEEIPYETVFFRRSNPVSRETMGWAESVIDEYEASGGDDDYAISGSWDSQI